MGYGAYKWARRINHPIINKLRYPISKFLEKSSKNRNKRAALLLNSPTINWKSHIFSQEQYLFTEHEINKLLLKSTNYSIIEEINKEVEVNRKLSYSEKQAFFDLNNYLVDDLLVKVDRASMFNSLELRVPILDHEIVEFALNIDKNLKQKNGTQKYILKQLIYDYVPEKIMDRPKWGFSIPLEKWLKNDLDYLIEKYLNKNIIEELGVLNYNEVENLIHSYNQGENYLYNRIWCLIILNKFLSQN
jgi:asparagine synthase (glutamine-hydrolysing)